MLGLALLSKEEYIQWLDHCIAFDRPFYERPNLHNAPYRLLCYVKYNTLYSMYLSRENFELIGELAQMFHFLVYFE